MASPPNPSPWCLIRLSLLALAVAVGGCECDEPLADLLPALVVSPGQLDLGTVRTATSIEDRIQLGNRGAGALGINSITLEDDSGPFSLDADLPTGLAAGDARDVIVRFLAPAPIVVENALVIRSTDPETPELRVPLRAEAGVADVLVSPNPIDLGDVNEAPAEEGGGGRRSVIVENTGFDVLAVTAIGFVDDVGFTHNAAVPVSLLPGEQLVFQVALLPNAAIAAHADDARGLRDTLRVTTSVGDEDVPVRASINLAPVAVAVEEQTRRTSVKVPIGTPVAIDGSGTSDPEGDDFTLTWTVIERPTDSAAVAVGQGTPRARVTPDIVGRYLVRLRAVDVHGAVGTADVELLPRDLTVVLTWTASGSAVCRQFSAEQCAAFSPAERAQRCCDQSDLDLHLIAPGGVLGDYGQCPATCEDELFCAELSDAHVDTCRATGLDASFANRSPEWGVPGRSDDPRLDVDDVRGLGPEIISLNDPADGTYRVVVHYCLDRSDETSSATVQFFDQERLIGVVGPQTISEGQGWTAGVLVRANNAWQLVAAPGLFEDNVPADLCSR